MLYSFEWVETRELDTRPYPGLLTFGVGTVGLSKGDEDDIVEGVESGDGEGDLGLVPVGPGFIPTSGLERHSSVISPIDIFLWGILLIELSFYFVNFRAVDVF